MSVFWIQCIIYLSQIPFYPAQRAVVTVRLTRKHRSDALGGAKSKFLAQPFLDRCCGVIHCLGFDGKYGASVVASGGGDEPPIAEYMIHFQITTGVVPVGAVWATMGAIG